ncbi:MAG TPA: M90 family metallopeptidase [Xanthomonadales bacterium]|nr:M90 family metallopeptidase [Xanthomonadales bacterium]
MISWWRRRFQRRAEPDAQAYARTIDALPQLGLLDADARGRLLDYTGRFLLDKRFSGAHGLEVDLSMGTTIAQLACWPVLDLGYDCLSGWREVIVYPGAFRARRAHDDEDTGVAHEWDEDLVGESWDNGPLILSWEDLCLDLSRPEDLQNVVVHEIAHKLDARSGAADGAPPLPRSIDARRWAQTFQAAYDELCAQVDRDESQAAIDPYAASAPEEFFAVVSEYHFLAPELLSAAYPEVARLTAQFYAGGRESAGRRA